MHLDSSGCKFFKQYRYFIIWIIQQHKLNFVATILLLNGRLTELLFHRTPPSGLPHTECCCQNISNNYEQLIILTNQSEDSVLSSVIMQKPSYKKNVAQLRARRVEKSGTSYSVRSFLHGFACATFLSYFGFIFYFSTFGKHLNVVYGLLCRI